MRLRTAQDLKTLLASVPDEALVLVPGSDHSYSHAHTASYASVVVEGRDHYAQDFGQEHDDAYSRPFKRIKALIIGE